MRRIQVTVGPLTAASANNIATAQTISGASSVAINGALASGGVATLDTPRRVLITSVGNDSGITFTVTGITFALAPVSETVTGTNASAVATNTDFAKVTSIVTSGSTAANITVGTNGVAGSQWVFLDQWSIPYTAIQCNVTGTVNYTVQQTLDDPNSATYPVTIPNVTWVNSNDPNVVAATTTQQTNYIFPPMFARVLLNSGTGSVTSSFNQAGVTNI